MKPPDILSNILDDNNGATIISKFNFSKGPTKGILKNLSYDDQKKVFNNHGFDTLWRPARVFKNDYEGVLIGVNENSFYQNNDNVTIGFYILYKFPYIVVCWFDNATGKRIA